MIHRLTRSLWLPHPRAEVFAFFADAANLERITPPELRFRILTPMPLTASAGAVIDYRLSLHRLPWRWRSCIDLWEPGRRFIDRQLSGPFRVWEHIHTFERRPGGTLIRDLVLYRMPYGALGALAVYPFIIEPLLGLRGKLCFPSTLLDLIPFHFNSL